MPHTCFKIVLPMLLGLFAASQVRADIIANSIAASVSAANDPGPPLTSSSTLDTDSISQTWIGNCNNFAAASETDHRSPLALALTGTGLISNDKTPAKGPGRPLQGIVSWTLALDPTKNSNDSLGETEKFSNDSLMLSDSASRRLNGPSTNFSQTAIPKAIPSLVLGFVFGLALLVFIRRGARHTAFATRVGNARGMKSRAESAEPRTATRFPDKSRRTASRKFDSDELAARKTSQVA